MIRWLIILLLIVGCVYADIQLVKGDEIIRLKKGKKFSVNNDQTKYKFDYIKSGKINGIIDIQSIEKINLYSNYTKKGLLLGSSTGFLSFFIPLSLRLLKFKLDYDPPNYIGYNGFFKLTLMISSAGGVAGGVAGSIAGLVSPKVITYYIHDEGWKLQVKP